MSPRRGAGAALTASPVLVGAVTVLVTIVAVFLSYNANSGLPFVPTYDLKANVPNAAQLVEGFEVRIGGARVGAISKIEPKRREDGTTYAVLTLNLDKEVEPIAEDTTLVVRPRSSLGLKYLEMVPGESENSLQAGRHDPACGVHTAPGGARRVPQHVRRARPDRLAAEPAGLRDGLRGPRPGPERGDRRAQPAARGPRAGGAQPLIAADPARPLLPRAGRRGRRGGAGGRGAGRAVREPGHHLHGAGRHRAAVPPGDDHRRPAQRAGGDRGLPQAAAVPAKQRGPLPRARTGRGHAPGLGAGPG